MDLEHVFREDDSNYKQLNALNLLATNELPNVVQTTEYLNICHYKMVKSMLIHKGFRLSEV